MSRPLRRASCGGRGWIHRRVCDAQYRSGDRQSGGRRDSCAAGAKGQRRRVYPIGAISVRQEGHALAEVGEMVGRAPSRSSDDGRPVASAQLKRTALEYFADVHDSGRGSLREPTLAVGGAMNEGIVSARLGLRGVPSEAEEIMVIREHSPQPADGRPHPHRARVDEGIGRAHPLGKDRGINVTAEVCPHHLSLTEDAVEGTTPTRR